jgi:hypothetical protein
MDRPDPDAGECLLGARPVAHHECVEWAHGAIADDPVLARAEHAGPAIVVAE